MENKSDPRFLKLRKYLVNNKKFRARFYVMRNRDLCDNDFIVYFKKTFIGHLVKCAISISFDNEWPQDTKILFHMADILGFKKFDENHEDVKLIRAVPYLKERALINGLKIAALETIHLLASDYKSNFLEMKFVESIVLASNAFPDKAMVMNTIEEIIRDSGNKYCPNLYRLGLRLCSELEAINDLSLACNIMKVMVMIAKSLQHHPELLEHLMESGLAKCIIDILKCYSPDECWLLISETLNVMIMIINIIPGFCTEWLRYDIRSSLCRLLSRYEIKDVDEIKFAPKDIKLVDQAMRIISIYVPNLPKGENFDLLNTHDQTPKDASMPDNLLKSSEALFTEFMVQMFDVALVAVKVLPSNRNFLITILKVLYHMDDHESLTDEGLAQLIKHLTRVIYSQDIIIRSTAICIAAEILMKGSKSAIRRFHKYGLIDDSADFINPLVDPDHSCPMTNFLTRRVANLKEALQTGRKEAFSTPYGELVSIKNLLNESMADAALKQLRGLMSSQSEFTNEDIETSDITAGLVAYFLPHACNCSNGSINPSCCISCRMTILCHMFIFLTCQLLKPSLE